MTAGEFDTFGELGGDGSDDDDDIARFERQCAERARSQGVHLVSQEDDDEDGMSDDDQCAARAPMPEGGGGEWQQRCAQLQQKLARREADLAQARSDLEMLKSEGTVGDAGGEIKQRLLEVTKKYRRAQVTVEGQKGRIQQLESEMKKPREEVRKQAEELAAQTYGAILGDGEDYKKKFLQTSNKLQEARQEVQELRLQTQRQRKVLLKELGADDAVERALSTVDDPQAAGWKGRASQISQLQRQVRELKEQSKRSDGTDLDEEASQKARRTAAVSEKDRAAVTQAAEKRREEFERLQEEVERLRNDQAEAKHKRDAMKSRTSMLEGQLKELKAHVQTLVGKSENDDALVSALRRQLGHHGSAPQAGGDEDPGELESLREDNEKLQEQLERQAQIVLQLKQKQLAAKCEAGAVRLGPQNAGTPHAVSDRMSFLEAENAKQTEHVKLLQRQLGENESTSGRPFSAESSMNLKERLRQMGDRLAMVERENLSLRQRGDERPSSSASARSNSNGPRGIGPDMDQLLRQNEALKRELARTRAAGGSSRERIGSPCSSLGGDM